MFFNILLISTKIFFAHQTLLFVTQQSFAVYINSKNFYTSIVGKLFKISYYQYTIVLVRIWIFVSTFCQTCKKVAA